MCPKSETLNTSTAFRNMHRNNLHFIPLIFGLLILVVGFEQSWWHASVTSVTLAAEFEASLGNTEKLHLRNPNKQKVY